MVKINQVFTDSEEDVENLPEISLAKGSSSPLQIVKSPENNKSLTQDQIASVELTLKQSEKQLPQLSQILKLYQSFDSCEHKSDKMIADLQKMSQDNSGNKLQLQALNQVL